jgi:hypothetical protein
VLVVVPPPVPPVPEDVALEVLVVEPPVPPVGVVSVPPQP